MTNIHHLNCGSMRPIYPRVNGLVHCLLIESNDGLVLVDTGFGAHDYTHPSPLMNLFLASLRSPRDLEETAANRVKSLGYDPQDVRHIVMTHLHLDHAGGLPEFPHAQVHVYHPEHQAAMNPRTFVERFYRPEHWAHGPHWVLHDLADETWFGLPAFPVQFGLEPEMVMAPLIGHTRGHCGVAVKTKTGWLFQTGDASGTLYLRSDPNNLDGPEPDRLSQWLIGPHVPRLRALKRQLGDLITMISSHDGDVLARLQAQVD